MKGPKPDFGRRVHVTLRLLTAFVNHKSLHYMTLLVPLDIPISDSWKGMMPVIGNSKRNVPTVDLGEQEFSGNVLPAFLNFSEEFGFEGQ